MKHHSIEVLTRFMCDQQAGRRGLGRYWFGICGHVVEFRFTCDTCPVVE